MNLIYKILRKMVIKMSLIKIKLFNKSIILGRNINFRKAFNINCEKEGKIVIGDNVFFNNYCSINSHKLISIGDNCIFGENVKIYDHNHVFNKKNKKIQEQGFSCKNIEIQENCWIGSNVIILAGSKIGKNSVIGAGTIIKGNIPSDSVITQKTEYFIRPIRYDE